jgi:hypothetical protein
MSDRKPHVWPWIAALLVVLPLLHFASLGPACDLWDDGWIPDDMFFVIYGPLASCIRHSPPLLREAEFRLATCCGGDEITLYFLTHP